MNGVLPSPWGFEGGYRISTFGMEISWGETPSRWKWEVENISIAGSGGTNAPWWELDVVSLSSMAMDDPYNHTIHRLKGIDGAMCGSFSSSHHYNVDLCCETLMNVITYDNNDQVKQKKITQVRGE